MNRSSNRIAQSIETTQEASGRGFADTNNIFYQLQSSIGYALSAMGAGDIIETIRRKRLEPIILSILQKKPLVAHSSLPRELFDTVGSHNDSPLSPEIAKIIMDAKDRAGAVTGVSGATGDIRLGADYSKMIAQRFPKIHNVKILSLPGAASLTMLGKIQELGIGIDNTTVVSPNGVLGGIWTDSNIEGVSSGSKINPGDFVYSQDLKLNAARNLVSGSGKSIRNFVNAVGEKIRAKNIIRGEVKTVERDSKGSGYIVTFLIKGGKEVKEHFDIVLFGPGADIALPFINSRIQQVDTDGMSLVHETTDNDPVQTFGGKGIEIKSHRWQNNPAKIQSIVSKLKKNRQVELLIFGFGNSAIEVILHCIENGIKFRVISDSPIEVFQYPEIEHILKSGKRKRLARILNKQEFNPQSGIAYDYPEVKKLMNYLLQNYLIETNVGKVEWRKYKGKIYADVYQNDTGYPYKSIETIDENFCLYGYMPDTAPISSMVHIEKNGTTATDWTHQGISKRSKRPLPGLFVHGLAAYGKNNAVLPGIGYDVPATVVAALLHSVRLHEQGELEDVSLGDRVKLLITSVQRKIKKAA